MGEKAVRLAQEKEKGKQYHRSTESCTIVVRSLHFISFQRTEFHRLFNLYYKILYIPLLIHN